MNKRERFQGNTSAQLPARKRERFLGELEACWRAITLMFTMLDLNKIRASNLQSMVEALLERLVKGTGATQARICLEDAEQTFHVKRPERSVWKEDPCSLEEVYTRTQLQMPVLSQGEAVGSIHVRKPKRGTEFGTQEKKLVKAIAGFLAIMIDRDRILKTRFADHRLQAMLHKIWEITELPGNLLSATCDKVVRVIPHGIPCCSAAILLWNGKKRSPLVLPNAVDSKALKKLVRVVKGEAEECMRNRSIFARSCRRALDERSGARKHMEPLNALIVVPLTRLTSYRGVLAVGRDEDNAEFSTVEKHVLCTVSGLIVERGT